MYQIVKTKLNRLKKFVILFPFMVKENHGLWLTIRELSFRFVSRGVYDIKEYCRISEQRKRAQFEENRHQGFFMSSLIDSFWNSVEDDHVKWLKKQKKKQGYIVYTLNYSPNSAGVACTHRLCNYLNHLGYPSYIANAVVRPPDMKVPWISKRNAKKLATSGYTVVYPEVISGNPLNAPYVARWVMNRPGFMGGEGTYDNRELVFYYSDVYLPYIRNRTVGKLYMPTIDESIFYDEGNSIESRSLDCYYVGKSTWKEGYFSKHEALEITREYPPKRDLGKLLRASRVLYCFDNSTILAYEAILCGCPVVIIPDGTQTWEDYQKLELGTEGISWGLNGLKGIKIDVDKVKERFSKVKLDFKKQLLSFIYLTQRKAMGCDTIRPSLDSLESF